MALFTTDLVPPPERAAFMGELVSRQFMETRVSGAGDGPVHGRVKAAMISELPVAELGGVNLRALRTRAHVARSSPFYFACIQTGGWLSIRRGEQDIALTAGDVYFEDSQHAFEVDIERPFRHLVIRVPKPWLDARVARPDLVAGTVLRRGHPVCRLFASYVAHGLEAASAFSVDAAALFSTHAVELMAQVLGERPAENEQPLQAVRAALYVRACRLIALRFAEPGLAPEQIARALGVSLRLLQRIFAERGDTIMRRLWNERVERAANLLAAREAAHRSVTEIAFACGFNDSAHFTRAFVALVGETPSRWRQEALALGESRIVDRPVVGRLHH